MFIHDENAVLNGVKQRLKKTPFAREPLDDRLQTFGIEPPNAAKHLV
jgi:hypothetical protein